MLSKNKIKIIVFVVLLVVLLIWFYVDYYEKKSEIIFLDVGQGDSCLIDLAGDNEILIDGGPNKTVLYKLGKYLPIYNRSIELMVLTHPHADHVSGLVEVLKRYEVKKVMQTGTAYNSEVYEYFQQLIKQKNIENLKPEDFNSLSLAEGFDLEIIYPQENLANKKFDDVNEASIVFRLNTLDKNFLLTGDISLEVEDYILESFGGEVLRADVLKVAHQGSDTSSGVGFLEAVNPNWAVISVGENNFGHPSLRVIRRLQRVGADILRTDRDGDVRFDLSF